MVGGLKRNVHQFFAEQSKHFACPFHFNVKSGIHFSTSPHLKDQFFCAPPIPPFGIHELPKEENNFSLIKPRDTLFQKCAKRITGNSRHINLRVYKLWNVKGKSTWPSEMSIVSIYTIAHTHPKLSCSEIAILNRIASVLNCAHTHTKTTSNTEYDTGP